MAQAFDPSAVRSGSVFSDNPNYNAVWVCYINGVEVPILGFNITSGVWQPPQFEIYMLPDVSLQRLGNEDRVPVQIFYMDYWNVVDKPELRLLVDGEIRGYRSKKVVGQRVMSFTCMSHINIFEKLYFFFMNTVDDIVAAQSPELRTQGFSGQGLFYPYSLFHQGLFVNSGTGSQAEVQTTSDAPDPPQGAMVNTAHEVHYNIIKGIIGGPPSVPGLSDDKRTLPMMNFFARHTRKVRLHQRFVRLPSFEDISAVTDRKGIFPIFAAVRADEALMAMQHQVAGRIGNSGPVWDMLKQIYSLVYMEFAAIPNPAAVHTNLEGEILGPVTAGDPLIQQIAPTAVTTVSSPATAPPTSGTSAAQNVAASNLRAAQAAEASALAASRAIAGPALFDGEQNRRFLAGQRAYGEARARTAAAQAAVTAAATPPAQSTPAPVTTVTTNGQTQTSSAEVRPGTATQGPIGCDPARPIRLAQFFAKPQFLFGIPPHCNVVFPSMIDDLSYGEDYGEQPTRVYVNDSVMGNVLRSSGTNREFMIHALTVAYPEEADAVMHANTPDAGATSGTLHSTGKNLLLWPEEFYKGPVTAKVELPSWFQTMMQFLNAREETPAPGAVGSLSTPGTPGTVTPAALVGPSPVISIPQRGRVDTRAYLPDSWVLPPDVVARGDAHRGIKYNYGQPGLIVPGQQIQPAAALVALAAHIQRIFPGHIQQAQFMRGGRSATGGSRLNASVTDLHQFGRACDLMIRMRGRAVDHVLGDPVANWLVNNAAAFGIQFMVWATTRWNSSQRPGYRHGPYGNENQDNTALHRDHIHFEINLDAAQGLLGGYAAIGVPATSSPATLAASAVRPAGQLTVPVITPPSVYVAPPTAQAPQRTVTRVTNGAPPGTVALPGTGTNNPASRAENATSTTTGAAADGPTELPANEKFAEIFRLYAQYEYARQRYMQKNGALQIRFNPYVLAGFPLMAFDRATTSEHIVAYVYTVNHAAMGKSISTNVGLTCVRTFPEFLNDVRNDCERFSERITAAPAEMIPEVRNLIQKEDAAETFYQRLLYGGPRPGNVPAAFRFDRALGYTRGLNVEDISITATEETTTTSVPGQPAHDPVTPQAQADYDRAMARLADLRRQVANVHVAGSYLDSLHREISSLERSTLETYPNASPAVQSAQTALNAARAQAAAMGTQSTQRDQLVARIHQMESDLRTQVARERPETPAAGSTAAAAAPAATTTTEVRRTVTHNIDPNEALTPLPNTIYTDAFDSYHIGMQLAARNVCTLTEFIRFWHGGRTLGDLISSGEVVGVDDTYNYGAVVETDVIAQGPINAGPREVTVGQATRYTGTFYARIFKLRQGPGTPPSEAERGYTAGATPSGTTSGVSADYPQTRADWDSVLMAYRLKARSRLSPNT